MSYHSKPCSFVQKEEKEAKKDKKKLIVNPSIIFVFIYQRWSLASL
jgi:hypothetical protein